MGDVMHLICYENIYIYVFNPPLAFGFSTHFIISFFFKSLLSKTIFFLILDIQIVEKIKKDLLLYNKNFNKIGKIHGLSIRHPTYAYEG